MIGNAHIDPIWLWQWREGYQEIKATFQSALDRLDETPGFIFTCACTDYYIWVEENAPDIFAQIQRRVKEGSWKIVGGMWVQPDCNMPSGEAFARHLTYSQRYFKEKFGVTVKTGYNVDSFGHSAMLPQLLARAGFENYVMMRPGAHENPNVPAPLFTWKSMDGSSVTTFRIPESYCTRAGDMSDRINSEFALADRTGFPIMGFYGVGNHGGGPTIRNIQSILAYMQTNPRGGEVCFSSPDQYFDEVKARGLALPVWESELQHHASGCYSAHPQIKRQNRHSETALVQAEIFASLAARLTGHVANSDSLKRAWSNLMFCQFHDVLCGCSIEEAYTDADHMLGESQMIAAREENAALQKLSWRVDTMQGIAGRKRSKESDFGLWELDGLGTPVVVFNPHSFEVTGGVHVCRKVARVTDNDGRTLPIQTVRASRTNGPDKWDSLFEATVPALGYRLYWVYLKDEEGSGEKAAADDAASCECAASGLKITETSIANRNLSACFDKTTGALTSLTLNGREFLSAPACAKLIDVEASDTWAHGDFTFDKEAGQFGEASFMIVEQGPVRATLRVTTRYNNSALIQDYMLYPDSTQLEVDAKLTLYEHFRHVKLCFPVIATSPTARAELSYGYIERAPNGEEETGHRWMQLGDADGGIALTNESKYSFCAKDNELRLTVANSSIYADHYGQRTRDELCRFLDQGEQAFRYGIVPVQGDWRQSALTQRAALLNQPLTFVTETYHQGDLPAQSRGIAIDRCNVQLGALKRAEDGSGIIARFNETTGLATQANVDFALYGRAFALSFAPCEVKTVLIPDDEAQPVREVMLTEY